MTGENRYLTKLALKNIGRNRGRSFFIGFSVTLSVVMAAWILAFFDGLNHQIEHAVVTGNVGHWQLQEANFAASTDPTTPARWSQTDYARLASAVKSFSPEIVVDGFISGPEGSAGLQVIGVDFALHARTFNLDEHLVAGAWPRGTDRGVVIGQDLAQRFRYVVGENVVINFQDAAGELKSELLPILAIYQKNGRSFERRHAYVHHTVVQEFLFGQAQEFFQIHRVNFLTSDLAASARAMEELARQEKLELRSWKQINPEMGVVLDFHEGLIRFFFVIIGLTVTVTILTPVSMLWQERLAELKMMSVIGVPEKKIWRLGMLESLAMALIAGSASALFIALIIGLHSKTGINFRDIAQGQVLERAGIQLPRIVYPLLLPKQLVVSYGFVAIVVGLSYAFAIRKVLRRIRGGAE